MLVSIMSAPASRYACVLGGQATEKTIHSKTGTVVVVVVVVGHIGTYPMYLLDYRRLGQAEEVVVALE